LKLTQAPPADVARPLQPRECEGTFSYHFE